MNTYQIVGICCVAPVMAFLSVAIVILFFETITEHPKEAKTWVIIAMFISTVVGVICLAIGEAIK